MAAGRADEHSDFDAAFSAGMGVSGRLWCRSSAGNMRTTLGCDERVADLAPTGEHPSWGDAVCSNVEDRRSHRHPDRGRERPRPIRSLVMVTNRRVIEGVHPNEFRDFALERVTEVQVRSRSRAIGTVRVSTDGQDRDIDLPPRRSVAELFPPPPAAGMMRVP